MEKEYESLKLLRALYVEDDELVRFETEAVLGEYFDGLVTALDGEDALGHYEIGKFDIVITDISMPKMDGVELCRVIKELSPKQRIVVTSGTEDTGHMIDLVNIGVNRFMSKPVQYERLLDYLNEVAMGIENERRIVEYQNLILNKNEELEQTLGELQETQKQLVESEKMASLGALVSGVAHEMNTPVGICITGMTHLAEKFQLLEKDFNDNQLKRSVLEKYITNFQEAGALIDKNLHKAARLVQVFKQMSVDQHVGDLVTYDLEEFMQNVIVPYRQMMEEKEIVLHQHVMIGTEVKIYPEALHGVMSNLLENAIEHGNKGERGEVTIRVGKEEGWLVLSVHNNGEGIPLDNMKDIFTPFFTTARGEGRTGLGLSIVYNLVTHKLGGVINCESDPGTGTTFTVKVPYVA